MAGLTTELAQALSDFADTAEELLRLAGEKKEAVIRNNTEALKLIVSSENEAVGRAQRLERRRAALFDDIAVVLNIPKDGLTLDRLIAIIKSQPECSPIESARARLSAALSELKTANDTNRALIDNALDYIDFNINVLRTTFVDEAQDYYDHGKKIDIKN